MQVVKQAIQSRGFVVRDETLNSRDAWLGSLPGHVYANVRRPIVHTINLAHLMPVSAVWAGDQENAHLRERVGRRRRPRHCSTAGDTPFRLNLAVQDVGHTLIIGPTGAGKSTLLALLAMQWLRYPGAKVVIFDKDRSARAATLAVGGDVLRAGRTRRPRWPSSRSRDIDERAERIWATQFVLNLLAAQRHPETPQLKARIAEALASLATAPPRAPHLERLWPACSAPSWAPCSDPTRSIRRPAASARSSTPTTTSSATPRGSTSRWAP